jgi:hypothetical protein
VASYGNHFRKRLRRFGLSSAAINAAWPAWWSEAADASPSATAELHFSIARKLGLDPRSLLDDEAEPRFVWNDEAKFKNLLAETPLEQAAMASFAASIARVVLQATTATAIPIGEVSAKGIRDSILARQPYVRLIDLLGLAWGIGIPVVHLRIFPLDAKRAAAMTTKVGDRYVVLLAKDSGYPAWLAYYLAHELGHIFCGHLSESSVMVDMEQGAHGAAKDSQEDECDRFALELLTGSPDLRVTSGTAQPGATQLARRVLESADSLRIEPGTLALCFGHETGNWETVNASLKEIYEEQRPVWAEINKVARGQLDSRGTTEESWLFLEKVLGAP